MRLDLHLEHGFASAPPLLSLFPPPPSPMAVSSPTEATPASPFSRASSSGRVCELRRRNPEKSSPGIFDIFIKGRYELNFQIFCLWILRGPGAGVSSGRFLVSMAARSHFPPKNNRSRLPSWLSTSHVAQIERRCASAGAHTRTHTASLRCVGFKY